MNESADIDWEEFMDSPEAVDQVVTLLEHFDAEKLLEVAQGIDHVTAGQLLTAIKEAIRNGVPLNEIEERLDADENFATRPSERDMI
jgi:hypothetical protein